MSTEVGRVWTPRELAKRGPLGALDSVTQFDHFDQVTLFRGALEASAGRRRVGPVGPRRVRDVGDRLSESERCQRWNRFRETRRYAVTNSLSSMLTLTRSGAVGGGRDEWADDVVNLMRRSKRQLGFTFPYVWVLEGGGSGLRTHAHMLLPNAVAERVSAGWKGGGVTDEQHLGTAEEIRAAAHYVTKDLSTGGGRQIRTPRCSSFRPEREQYDLPRSVQAVDFLSESFGSPPCVVRRVGPEGAPVGASMFWDRTELGRA